MEVTGWTCWNNTKYIELSEERWKYHNKNKDIRKISPDAVKSYAKDHNISNDEAATILLDEYDKISTWTDEAKVAELENLESQVWEAVVKYCVANHILVTDYEHQGEDWGVPVIDNEYRLELSLRTWSCLMSDVWNEILGIDTLGYLDFYCHGTGEMKDFNKPLDVLNKKGD